MFWARHTSGRPSDHLGRHDHPTWPFLAWAADCAVLPFGLSVCMAGFMSHLTVSKLPVAFILVLLIALLPPRPLALPTNITRRRQLRRNVLLGLWAHGWRMAAGLGTGVLFVAGAITLILNGRGMLLTLLPSPDKMETSAAIAVATAVEIAWPALVALCTIWLLLAVGNSWLRTFNRPLVAWTGLWLRPERRAAAMQAWVDGQQVFLALSAIPLGLWLLEDLGMSPPAAGREAGWLLVIAQIVRLHLFRMRAPVPASVTLRRWPGRPWRLTLSVLLTLAGILFTFAEQGDSG